MNLVGYLLTLANLQGFKNSEGGSAGIEDISIKVGEIHSILFELGKYYSQFRLENFKDTGYYRNGNVGLYLSKNLRDYVYNGVGNPTDEAVLLILIFNDIKNGGVPSDVKDPSLSFFLSKNGVDDDVRNGVDKYVQNLKNRRLERTVSDTTQ
nr:uncharacterized protein LOC128671182 [Plodia interpunctella]